jgi:hypothetical protein
MSATTNIVITNQNQPPTADAGDPYSGVAGVAISFSGAGAGDPDGDALTYAWDFGDGNTGSGVSPVGVVCVSRVLRPGSPGGVHREGSKPSISK